MINIKNNLEYNLLRQRILGGAITGIWKKDTFFIGESSYPVMNYNYITANFTNFEKFAFPGYVPPINYHLSGYGLSYNKALSAFLGESTERYSFSVLYQNIKHNIIYSDYQNLQKKYSNCYIVPLNYINIYFSKEDKENYITKKDPIRWIALNSLFDINKKVLVPLQFYIMYTNSIFKNEKRIVNSATSTGTASQESFDKSLENAIVEFLQIDSFNLWWYGGLRGKNLNIDTEGLLKELFPNNNRLWMFLKKFTVNFIDISFDKAINVVVCEITSNSDSKLPKYVVGVQGGFCLNKCIERSFFECVTVLEYCFTQSWVEGSKFKKISTNIDDLNVNNLDDNVLFYAKNGKETVKSFV